MKTSIGSFFKKTLYAFMITMLITIPVLATWASSLTDEDVKLWKMWFNLARNGYAEPMKMNSSVEKPWWKIWD